MINLIEMNLCSPLSVKRQIFSRFSRSRFVKKKLIKMRKSVSVGDVNAEMKAAAKWSRSRLVDSGIASRRIRITSMRMATESWNKMGWKVRVPRGWRLSKGLPIYPTFFYLEHFECFLFLEYKSSKILKMKINDNIYWMGIKAYFESI